MAIGLTGLEACSRTDPNRKETYPVTGSVYVDEKPAGAVQVTLHDQAGVDVNNPTFSMTFTQADGSFALSTYEEGDGVPAGEYTITFQWRDLNPLNLQYSGPDKLGNKYSDPQTTPFRVKVEPGKPVDLGRIELSTK